MATAVGKGVYDDHVSLQFGEKWTDTFVLKVYHDKGLPPWDYAEAVRSAVKPLQKGRPGASLWIPVVSPGSWFCEEFKFALRIRNLGLAISVTNGIDQKPTYGSFFVPPVLYKTECRGGVPYDDMHVSKLTDNATQALLALTRFVTAYTSEVASACLKSEVTAREALWELEGYGYVEYHKGDNEIDDHLSAILKKSGRPKPRANDKPMPYWKVKRSGISIALRIWGVPPSSLSFQRHERNRLVDGDHRRKSRQWTAWLKKALPHAEIYTGWSEVGIPRMSVYPDSLAWGRLDGFETLFWMEVETGKTSRDYLLGKMAKRWQRAKDYARITRTRLVFTFLAMPWVRDTARMVFFDVPADSAVIVADWQEFGVLPSPRWGSVTT